MKSDLQDLKYSKVVFTGDVLRPFKIGLEWESASWKNIRWLQHMLKAPLQFQKIENVRMAWDPYYSSDPYIFYDAPSIYSKFDLAVNLDSWAKICRITNPPEFFLESVKHLQGSLVIGYELPEIIIHSFKILEIPYIDIAVHPIRFLPDLLFGFNSNVKSIQHCFYNLRLSNSIIQSSAQFIKAKTTWMKRPSPRLMPGTALILGQVSSDRAMVNTNGYFENLTKYKSEIQLLCTNHSEVLYKPHPYQVNKVDQDFLKYFPTIKQYSGNLYHLLGQPELTKVAGLNSSVLHESKFFDLESENLMPFLYDFSFGEENDLITDSKHYPISNIWLSTEFWVMLFNDEKNNVNFLQNKDKFIDSNLLRKSLNADWGWSDFDKVVVQ